MALEEKHLNPTNNTILIEQALVNVTGKGIVLKETKSKRKRIIFIPPNIMNDLVMSATFKNYQLSEAGEEREWQDHSFWILK